MFKGLPGEACPCPHWGYLFSGRITVGYADHDEVYEAGDAFYMSPGHVPAAEAGSEFVQFSPREALAEVREVMMRNAKRDAGSAVLGGKRCADPGDRIACMPGTCQSFKEKR